MATTPLAEFLRARREMLRPDSVGLPADDARRVPGLRRDELAALAGISTHYYVRLEQGRDRHPSPQVLDALARALQLDEHGTVYLHRLAQPHNGELVRASAGSVPAGLDELVEAWPLTPALVLSLTYDVLASNRLARAVAPFFAPGCNMQRGFFVDPRARPLFGDEWEAVTRTAAAGLRAVLAAHMDDAAVHELVSDLSANSERFRELWARHEVFPCDGPGITTFHHPQVGRLDLHYAKFPVPGDALAALLVYRGEPGSLTERRLAQLAEAAGARPAAARAIEPVNAATVTG